MRVAFILALLVVLHGTSVAEGQTILSPSPRTTVGAISSAAPSLHTKNPFANLFASELQPPTKHSVAVALPGPVQIATPGAKGHPRVVCGMTLVPVDPEFDAAMPRVVPESGRKFTIRLVPPRVCGR